MKTTINLIWKIELLTIAGMGEIVTADNATDATDPEHQGRRQKQANNFD